MRDKIKQNGKLDLELRQSYLGTSEWAVVAGLYNNYKTPYDVYMDKIYGYEVIDNHLMRHGRDIEPIIAKWVEEDTGWRVAQDGYVRFHPKYDFLATNLDGIIYHTDGSESILEIKTASEKARESWGNILPIQYLVQIQGQMLITGIHQAYVAIETSGYKKEFEILGPFKPDDIAIDVMDKVVSKCVSFWYDHVIPQVAPDAINVEDLKKTNPQANGHSIIATPELKTKIDTLKQMKNTKKEIELFIKDLEFQIKDAMADAEFLKYENETLATWRNTKPRKSFDRATFAQEQPDVYEKYVKESAPGRSFRLK